MSHLDDSRFRPPRTLFERRRALGWPDTSRPLLDSFPFDRFGRGDSRRHVAADPGGFTCPDPADLATFDRSDPAGRLGRHSAAWPDERPRLRDSGA